MERKRTRGYCFTVNNYCDNDIAAVDHLCKQADYGIYGKEIGEFGTPHLQGYVYYKDKISFSTVKQMIPRAHIEQARGTARENRVYCTKEHNFIEYGDMPQQGKRTDLIEFRNAVLNEGIDKFEAYERFPDIMVRYRHAYNDMFALYLEKKAIEQFKKKIKPEVTAIIGPPGVGKTMSVYTAHEPEEVYKIEVADGSAGSTFWDGYRGQDVILIDDFHNNLKLDYMLRLLDAYPQKLNIKGGHVYRVATKIYITSNIPVEQWYQYCPEIHRKALFRRIQTTKTLHIDQESWLEELKVHITDP